ncbi:hypothetical protein PHSY_002345 [Pseudozyma hubeiensis SY62]|uniref:Shelterin complex subunit TPP1/Est3 domain-containing protein n=1 Tax=Pseudozyma hubeiensis (strain SY62) TaxID=1305764 RepID=R9P104_PSEHS|nr:hypothetical protein PHSY_002345 [Pseudozyma hubeiensis SY62]GAC94772.1 hypothetical protein PHSY_002345 [Pseudozyma hubeiensis SY62]
MSESLKSWLFPFCTTHATLASTLSLDLPDVPFHRGNRIQLLHLLTFPSSSSTDDIFALVGDRTHCIAARFSSTSLHHFHSTHSLPFTALKGALLTLTNVRITVDRVRVAAGAAGGKVYQDGQWGLVLDVRGWEVVGGMGEGVWFGGVRLITSENGVPRSVLGKEEEKGEQDKFRIMIGWMKRWIRYKVAVDRAEQHRRGNSGTEFEKQKGTGDFPTPAQRGSLLTTPPPKTQAEGKTQEESLESIPTQPSELDSAAHLWTDFDLDADLNVGQEIALDQWREVLPDGTASPTVGEENVAEQPSSQPHSRSDEDPDESRISDYEREARMGRRRKKRARSTTASGNGAVDVVEKQSGVEDEGQTRVERDHEEKKGAVDVMQQVEGEAVSIPVTTVPSPTQTMPAASSLPITSTPPQSTPTPPQNTTLSTHPPPPPPSSSSSRTSSTTGLKPPRKRKTRQAAIAAL